MAGANLIYGAGMIESGVAFDCGQFVMDNEFARMIKHAVGGIPVDDETLAVEDIAAVGPFGDFLSLDATLRHMRILSQPEVLDRRVREDWQGLGSHDLYAVCRRRPATSCASTCPSRCPPTWPHASTPSSKRPTAPPAWPDGAVRPSARGRVRWQ